MADRCTAKSKQTGEQCKRAPMPGQKVCRYHGGNAPQAKAKAAERVAEEKARQALGRLSFGPIEDPLTALSMLAGEAVAWKDLLAGHVAELERLRYTGMGGEQIRGEIQLFERALDRCGSILGMIARLNIDDRLAKVTEQQAAIVEKALGAALAELGLTPEQQREARSSVARHLRVVSR